MFRLDQKTALITGAGSGIGHVGTILETSLDGVGARAAGQRARHISLRQRGGAHDGRTAPPGRCHHQYGLGGGIDRGRAPVPLPRQQGGRARNDPKYRDGFRGPGDSL
jgi:hypothetical protein